VPHRIDELQGQRLLIVDDENPALARVQQILDLIGEALPQRVSVIVVPVARIDPAFFVLRSGLAGEFIQKIVNYRLKLAIVGDISAFTAAGGPLADFVRESNQGRNIFFLPDHNALADKLTALSAGLL
jgi:hypothetical protein